MNTPFKVDLDLNNEFVYKVIIVGELRRGSQLSSIDWKQTLALAKAAADKKKVIFDLEKLTYWDTGGMADVIGAVIEINKASRGTTKRAALIKPKIEHLFKLTNIIEFSRRKFPQYSIEPEDIPILKTSSEIGTFVDG